MYTYTNETQIIYYLTNTKKYLSGKEYSDTYHSWTYFLHRSLRSEANKCLP